MLGVRNHCQLDTLGVMDSELVTLHQCLLVTNLTDACSEAV